MRAASPSKSANCANVQIQHVRTNTATQKHVLYANQTDANLRAVATNTIGPSLARPRNKSRRTPRNPRTPVRFAD